MAKGQTLHVSRRARQRCEYCQMPEVFYRSRFQVDHVIAQQHGGDDNLDNLAWSCLHCNAHKGPNIAGVDNEIGTLTRLCHPREDEWGEHFSWNGPWLIGKTAVGRTTIAVLAINDIRYVKVREALIAEGVFPPG